MTVQARRGHVYRISFGPGVSFLGVIISNDRVNEVYDEYITLQISSNPVHENTAGAVRLNSGDPAFGHVICRDVGMVHQDELKEDLGRLSAETLLRVEKMHHTVTGP